MKLDSIDTTISTLGPPKIKSPIRRGEKDALSRNFVSDSDRVVVDVSQYASEFILRHDTVVVESAFPQ